ncbi:DUF1127 domain-containing protein [Brenneria rubrifaciens]|uniref:DUF1127 domain-containing protein n=1 Tax=Brenneria rubrifaciens TaxID=55213 RepID=A0A4V1FA61_9GAMM|nr:DUF1127 domain-containing protein [Brenneria rubrifaciens]QCR09953.1 DUF1127 domain-containing protein [Brenneria rubrifaciens]
MEHQAKCSPHSSGISSWGAIFILPYRIWKAWRLRVKTRRILLNMDDTRLEDIGLSRDDITRFK